MFNKQNFKKFLREAKANTYARDGEGAETKLNNGSKKFEYKKDEFHYQDIHFGFNPFAGQEIIFYQQKPIWAMNYRGQIIIKNILAKDVYKFLKKALQKVSLANPYRGPAVYKNGDFKYINRTKGNIHDFSGQEKIYSKNKLAYTLNYHGGKIIEKSVE